MPLMMIVMSKVNGMQVDTEWSGRGWFSEQTSLQYQALMIRYKGTPVVVYYDYYDDHHLHRMYNNG